MTYSPSDCTDTDHDEKDEETLLAEAQEYDESDNYRGDR